jgi:hypothetical protein
MENTSSNNKEPTVEMEADVITGLMRRSTKDLKCIRKTTHLMMMKRQQSSRIRLIKEMIAVRTAHALHLHGEIECLKLTYTRMLTGEFLKTQQLRAAAVLTDAKCKPGNKAHTKTNGGCNT